MSARYFPDFCSYLLLSAAIVALRMDDGLGVARSPWRLPFRLALLLAVLYGSAFNLAIGLTGYYDQYRKTRPLEYARIEDFFLPVQRELLRWTGAHGALRMELTLSERPAKYAETLVRLDSDFGEDAVCVRRRENGRVVFRYHHGSGPWLRSEPLALAPGARHVFELSAGSLYPQLRERVVPRLFPSAREWNPVDNVRLLLDGKEILAGQIDLEPGSGRVALGEKAPVCPVPFSGRILRAEQEYP